MTAKGIYLHCILIQRTEDLVILWPEADYYAKRGKNNKITYITHKLFWFPAVQEQI